ncbi:MAG: hypothetical protein M1818_006648 [Claussenomyces sp. TS43310]|nr:MAG: hypothetical protein M1818_006919 [Claussenomyces sp. TS43310]KAI9735071.1 MAG: hypothetical protein M1818_006648 [Claussenomyces sp. TS43310]
MSILKPAAFRIAVGGPSSFLESKIFGIARAQLVRSPLKPCTLSPAIIRGNCSTSAAYFLSSAAYRQHALSPPSHRHTTRAYATSSRVIRHYDNLPQGYEDGVGLAYRATPLSEQEATTIFGRGVGAANANRILRILHGRRVAGTLPDPSLSPPVSAYDERIKKIALAWLRENVPVDEDYAAGKRAELELQAMEAEILADSERLGLYKPGVGEAVPKGKNTSQSIYGESGIDAIREANQRKFDEQDKAEEARQTQADEIRQNTGTELTQNARSHVDLRRPGENPRLKYYLERAAEVVPDVPPEMSVWQRLWPSGLVVLCVVGTSIAFTYIYIPPSHGARLWPEMPPAAATIISLIVANSFVFLAWRFPPAFRLLNKYFLSVPAYPRGLSMVGNVFSHQSARHLLINMAVLWFMGTRLHDEIGRANFLALYLSSGAVSSFVSLASFAIRGVFVTSSLGASGAIAGVIASYLWLHGDDYFKLFWYPPDPMKGIPGLGVLSVVILMDVVGLFRGNKIGTNFDHVSHLAGYAAGIAGGEVMRRSAVERKRQERERRKNLSFGERVRSWR